MTFEELERGFELHEKRFARIDERLDRMAERAYEHEFILKRIDERLDRMSARDDEHDARLKRIEDNLLTQGELLNRIDQRVDRVADRLEGLTGIVATHTHQLQVLQSARIALFQRMDAFIRGLERGNGNAPGGGPP